MEAANYGSLIKLIESRLHSNDLKRKNRQELTKELRVYQKGIRQITPLIKYYVGEKAVTHARQTLQLHGGVGMTEELSIGHFFRHLTQFCSTYGTSAYHLERYVAAS